MPARSFVLVLVLKCFAWRQTAEVVSRQLEPKDAELRPRLGQVKDRVLRALSGSGASEESPGAVKRHGLARARRERCRFAPQHACA